MNMTDPLLHLSCPSCSPENAFCFVTSFVSTKLTLDLTCPCVIDACCVIVLCTAASSCAVCNDIHSLISCADPFQQLQRGDGGRFSKGPFPVTSSTVAMSESLHHNTSNHSFLQSHTPLRPQPKNNRRSERLLRYHAQSNDEMTRQDGCERQDDL